MKKWAAWATCSVVAILVFSALEPRIVHAVFTPTYTEQSVSVTSSTVPQLVLPGGCVTWSIRPRTLATNGLFCWHYSGTVVPASVPATCTTPTSTPSAGCQEIPVGGTWSDSDTLFPSPPTQQSVACALETGSTAVAVDTGCR